MSLGRRIGFGLLALAAFSVSPSAAQWGRATVSGLVFGDSDTSGLDGAKVELAGDAKSERLREVHLEATTSEGGKYFFERVPYGRYQFRVEAPGFEPYRIPLYVASDALTALHVQLVPVAGGK